MNKSERNKSPQNFNIIAVNGLEIVTHGNFNPTVIVGELYAIIRFVSVAEFALRVVAYHEKAQTLVFVARYRVIEHGSIAARISKR